MATQEEEVGHADLVGGGSTILHTHPGGGNGADVKSGQSTSPKATEAQVDFATSFASAPEVSITPTGDKGVWVTEVNVAYFKWNNNSKNTDVTVYWIATNAGNS